VTDEKPIDGVESFMPGVFKRARASALAKWPWTRHDALFLRLFSGDRRRSTIELRASAGKRLLYDPVGKHEHLSATRRQNFRR